MATPIKGNAVIGQSGGQTSVINQSLVGVIQEAKKAGFIVNPGGAKLTGERWKSDDADLYPILLDAGLVKARRK